MVKHSKGQNEVHQDNTGKTLKDANFVIQEFSCSKISATFLMFLTIYIVIILLFEEKN